MDAFFSSIRHYFKSEYNGRYFSIILREIAQHEPRSFGLMIDQIAKVNPDPFWREISHGVSSGEFTIKREYPFAGKLKKRRADLAILHGEVPIVLIEVKEFDHLASENPDQLSDYLNQVSRKVGFVHVHRFLPPRDETAKIQSKAEHGWPVAMLSYDQIYRTVVSASEENRALGALLCHYLEDIGVGIYRPVGANDRKALAFMMAQVLGFPHQAGMGKLQSEAVVRRGPELIKLLLGNAEVMGEWVRRPNEDIMRTHCATRFWIEPWLNHKKLRKNLRDSGEGIDKLPKGFQSYVEGGHIWFVANIGIRNGRLATNDYLQLELGFYVELEKGGSSPRALAYTMFKSKGINDNTYEESKYFKGFPNERRAFEIFASCLSKSRQKAIKLIAAAPKRKLIEEIKIPIALEI